MYDLSESTSLYDKPINYWKLIGRLKSGLYTFVDGHIYFNNDVIKIRYDLITSSKNQMYKESEIFDYYFDIFELEDWERIRSNTPLNSI